MSGATSAITVNLTPQSTRLTTPGDASEARDLSPFRCYNYVFSTHPTQHRYFSEVHLWQPLKPLLAPAFACMKGRL